MCGRRLRHRRRRRLDPVANLPLELEPLGLTAQPKVFEVGVCLTLGHHPPHRRAKQLPAQIHDRRRAEGGADLAELCQAVVMVGDNLIDTPAQVPERMAVRRQYQRHVAQAPESSEGLEVRTERVGEG